MTDEDEPGLLTVASEILTCNGKKPDLVPLLLLRPKLPFSAKGVEAVDDYIDAFDESTIPVDKKQNFKGRFGYVKNKFTEGFLDSIRGRSLLC